jgi:hypothetical protein
LTLALVTARGVTPTSVTGAPPVAPAVPIFAITNVPANNWQLELVLKPLELFATSSDAIRAYKPDGKLTVITVVAVVEIAADEAEAL